MRSHFIGPFLYWLRAEGVDLTPLLAAHGLDDASVGAPAIEIEHPTYVALLARAQVLTGMPSLGLRFAERATRVYGTLEQLWQNAPDARSALRAHAYYTSTFGGRMLFQLRENDAEGVLSFTCVEQSLAQEAVSNEFLLGWAVVQLRHLTGTPITPRSVRFAHPAPTDKAPHVAFFGCDAIEFSATDNALVFAAEVLDRRVALADPKVYEMLTERFLSASEAPPADFSVDKLHTVLRLALPKGRPTLGTVAATLGMSDRTLQRRLRDAGTSLERELDHCRMQIAAQMLLGRANLAEIAFSLGYRSESAFSRSFRKLQGVSPTEFRRSKVASS